MLIVYTLEVQRVVISNLLKSLGRCHVEPSRAIAMGSALGKRLQSGGRSEPPPETFAALCSADLGGEGGGRGTKGLTPRQRVRPDRQLDHGPRRNLPTAHIERLAGRGAIKSAALRT